MFTLFIQLPADIRRKIWIETLGPMTLTFTKVGPYTVECSGRLMQSRHMGNVALSDGSYKLFFFVKPSAAYTACKESRDFLRYVFAEPVKPDGGLPSWFDPAIDTVRFDRPTLVHLSRHTWFKKTQHLWIRQNYDACEYLERNSEYYVPEWEDKNHRWVENNLGSLKHITFEMKYVSGDGKWLEEWFPVFEEWFNHARWEPVSYSARVICYQKNTPEEEWLTPQNYLRVEKHVDTNRYQRLFGVLNWKELIGPERSIALVNATDKELENPGEFLKKHQHFGA